MYKFFKISLLLLLLWPSHESAAFSNPETALLTAIRQGNVGQVQKLLPQDIDQPLLNGRPGSTLLMYAVSRKAALPVIEMLISAGADPSVKDAEGKPVILLTALQQNNPQLIERLLPPDNQPLLNNLLLQSIAHRCQPEIIRRLIKHGADVNYTHRTGITPLIMATALSSQNTEEDTNSVIKVLLDAGAEANHRFLGVSAPEIAQLSPDRPISFSASQTVLSPEQQ